MLNKVKNTIEKYNMLQKSERILVGLSGGADSVSLLLCLKELGYKVSACHINHQLRGDESLRDEHFCITLCKKLCIPIEVHRIDVKGYCKLKSCSLEDGARKLRYDVFSSIDTDKIATAHSLSDSFETLLFNLVRGTGLKGLCSIPPVRDNIVRPLIDCSRDDIIAFLESRNQEFVTDSTNLQDEYSRNKIRLNVVPVFSQINPSLFSTFKNTLDNLKSDEQYIEMQVSELIKKAQTDDGYYADILDSVHDSLKKRAIAVILDKRDIRYSFEKINEVALLLKNGGKINLQSDKFAICENNIFSIKTIRAEKIKPVCIAAEIDVSYDFFGRTVTLEKIDYKSANIHKMLAKKPFDYDKIKGKLFIRNRKNGDKIRLCSRSFTSSVKKLFYENVPLENRDKTVILCDDDGIVWIEGFGCAERVKIDDNTKNILICKIS